MIMDDNDYDNDGPADEGSAVRDHSIGPKPSQSPPISSILNKNRNNLANLVVSTSTPGHPGHPGYPVKPVVSMFSLKG